MSPLPLNATRTDDAFFAGKGPLGDSSIFAPGHRGLTIGLVLVPVVVAFEGLAVTTIMPVTVRALHGLPLYAWSFSGFMLGSLAGTVAAGDYAAERGAAFSFTGALTILAAGLVICGVAGNMLLFIAGRVVEGLGTGAVRSLAWFAINRAYSARDHVRHGGGAFQRVYRTHADRTDRGRHYSRGMGLARGLLCAVAAGTGCLVADRARAKPICEYSRRVGADGA